MITRLIAALVGVHLLLLVLWYSGLWLSDYSWSIARLLQLPVARINGVLVTADQYLDDKNSIDHINTAESYSAEQKHQMLWQKLQDEYFFDSLAAQLQLQISPTVRQQLAVKTREQFQSSDKSTLGYTNEQFIDRVMIPWYREQAVRRNLMDRVPNPDRRALEAAVETIRAHPDQLETQAKSLAATYQTSLPMERVVSADDLIGPYSLVRTLAVGQISPVISDNDGYHAFIIKDKIIDAGVTTWRLQELFVPSITDQIFINQLKPKVRTELFIRNL